MFHASRPATCIIFLDLPPVCNHTIPASEALALGGPVFITGEIEDLFKTFTFPGQGAGGLHVPGVAGSPAAFKQSSSPFSPDQALDGGAVDKKYSSTEIKSR